MKKTLAIGATAVLFLVGLVLYLVNNRVGLALIFLSIFGIFCILLWTQQQIAARIAKIDRSITKTRNSVTWGNQEILKYSTSIFRRVQSSGYSSPSAGISFAAEQASGLLSTATVGRGATPEVMNPNSRETFASMLDPNRELKVAGIFFAEGLPGVTEVEWFPGSVVESLHQSIPDLVVIDELAMSQSAAWKESFNAVGTTRMKEIIAATGWLKEKGVMTFHIPAKLPPDVHSAALKNAPMTHLPLDESMHESDFGGPHTELFEALQQLAIEREGLDDE